MTNDLVTICTATMGNDSHKRLSVLLPELRRFTSMPYRHIVSDDGTINEFAVQQQRRECESAGAEHLINPGPFGVSHHLNFLIERVQTPWVLLVECGLRPSMGWLEAAYAFIDAIHGKKFAGHEVGMVGIAHLQDWCLRLGGATPSDAPVMDWWQSNRPLSHIAHAQFWSNWNDGYWSWPRMQAATEAACRSPEADSWEGEPANFRNLVRANQYAFHHYWPKVRRAGVAWYPGAFCCINLEAWRKVGRMRDGCCFFEGHLGLRLGLAGYAVLSLQAPPWLHRPSQCFSAAYEGKGPRENLGDGQMWDQDFRRTINDAPKLVDMAIAPLVQARINDALPEVPLLPGWEKWA